MIGDRWRDVDAGNAAGCKAFFVDYGYDEARPRAAIPARDIARVRRSDLIISKGGTKREDDEELKVKIFADGADKAGMLEMYAKPYIKGITTNPTLMRKAGITDYRAFAKDILAAIPDRPISFEVFSDEFREMERQAMDIAGWGDQRVRQDSDHQHASRALIRTDSHVGKAQDPCERYGHDDARPGPGDDGSSGG